MSETRDVWVEGEQLTRIFFNQVVQGDCIELMKMMPKNSVDFVYADPPYNLRLQQDLNRPDGSHVDAVDDHWDRFKDLEHYIQFTLNWLEAVKRVLSPTGTIMISGTYHNIYSIGHVLQQFNWWSLGDIVWIKRNPMPHFRGVRFCNAHETILWAQPYKRPYTFNYQLMKQINDGKQMRSDWWMPEETPDIWEGKICQGNERLKGPDGKSAHSTQKPEWLIERMLLACTNPGDVVLDPFLGSGTTGAVAKRLGRHWIGLEREYSYCILANNRIREVVPDETV